MAKKNIDLAVVLHDDCDYKDWLVELKERFYSHRLKASCATNGYLLDFYWKLGRDIEAKQYTNTYGSGFYKNLSQDLKNEMPGVKGFSPTNLKYMSYFYKLYAPLQANVPQVADNFIEDLYISDIQRVVAQSKNRPQTADDFKLLFLIPWDHHRRIIDKCKDDMDKALFFVRKTWENNWGRDALLNWLDTDLYERDGKAITNFQATLPAVATKFLCVSHQPSVQDRHRQPYHRFAHLQGQRQCGGKIRLGVIQGTNGYIRISTVKALPERLQVFHADY